MTIINFSGTDLSDASIEDILKSAPPPSGLWCVQNNTGTCRRPGILYDNSFFFRTHEGETGVKVVALQLDINDEKCSDISSDKPRYITEYQWVMRIHGKAVAGKLRRAAPGKYFPSSRILWSCGSRLESDEEEFFVNIFDHERELPQK
jgi:hypothetical protein